MHKYHPLFAGGTAHPVKPLHRRFCLMAGVLVAGALYGCAVHPLAAKTVTTATPTVEPMRITHITLERDCFGCASSVLSLQSNGRASFSTIGNERSGTASQTAVGSISAADFQRLAQTVLNEGFFDLADAYDDAQQADGARSTITVTRGTQNKRVVSRESAAPPAVLHIGAALDAMRSQTRWVVQAP
jgi:hypothetical protein